MSLRLLRISKYLQAWDRLFIRSTRKQLLQKDKHREGLQHKKFSNQWAVLLLEARLKLTTPDSKGVERGEQRKFLDSKNDSKYNDAGENNSENNDTDENNSKNDNAGKNDKEEKGAIEDEDGYLSEGDHGDGELKKKSSSGKDGA